VFFFPIFLKFERNPAEISLSTAEIPKESTGGWLLCALHSRSASIVVVLASWRRSGLSFGTDRRRKEDAMFVFSNFLIAAAKVLSLVLSIYMWIIIARAVLSWVNPDPYNPIVRFIHNLTEPLLYWIRRRFPVVFGGVDLAPMIALLAIFFLQHFVVASLFELAAGMR
jgi:YggT family protein